MRRRSDLALGFAFATVVHGLLLAAVDGELERSSSEQTAKTQEPLEIMVIDEASWRAQLEDQAASTSPQPLEARAQHDTTPLPDWPELSVAQDSWAAKSHRPAPISERIELAPTQEAPTRERLHSLPLVPRVAMEQEPEGVQSGERSSGAAAPVPLEAGSEFVLEEPLLYYPSRPLRRGIEGVVRVGLQVGATGKVDRTWVLRSSGNRELDRAARANIKKWLFDANALEQAGVGRSFRRDVRFEILD